MISPRRAAALGLDVPLTPIYIALLGLWPASDEEPLPMFVPPVALGAHVRPRDDLLQVPDWREEFRRAKVRRSNQAALAVAMAAVTCWSAEWAA